MSVRPITDAQITIWNTSTNNEITEIATFDIAQITFYSRTVVECLQKIGWKQNTRYCTRSLTDPISAQITVNRDHSAIHIEFRDLDNIALRCIFDSMKCTKKEDRHTMTVDLRGTTLRQDIEVYRACLVLQLRHNSYLTSIEAAISYMLTSKSLLPGEDSVPLKDLLAAWDISHYSESSDSRQVIERAAIQAIVATIKSIQNEKDKDVVRAAVLKHSRQLSSQVGLELLQGQRLRQ